MTMTDKHEHTQGDWYVNPNNFTQVITEGREDFGSKTLIATVHMGLQDANVIAAAPKMYALLKRLETSRLFSIDNSDNTNFGKRSTHWSIK